MQTIHGPAAGFQNQIQGEIISSQPFFDIVKLRLDRITVVDAEGLHNSESIAPVSGSPFLCLRDGGDSCLCPGKTYLFDIMNAAASLADTILYQILHQIHRKMELVVEVEQCLDLGWRQRLFHILFADK